MSPRSYLDYPPHILEDIINLLPQQSLINLASSNSAFYQPCVKKLYARIVISARAPLRRKRGLSGMDFQDSTRSVLFGSRGCHDEEANCRRIEDKLMLLLKSLKTVKKKKKRKDDEEEKEEEEEEEESALKHLVAQVHVFGTYDARIVQLLQQLIDCFKRLECFHISHSYLRGKLNTSKLELHSMIVDEAQRNLRSNATVTRLLLGLHWRLDDVELVAHRITSLILPASPQLFCSCMSSLVPMYGKPIHLPNLKQFRLVAHDKIMKSQSMRSIPWEKLQDLEIVAAPFSIECILGSFPASLDCLEKLSFVHSLHLTEQEDLVRESFAQSVMAFLSQLKSTPSFLSIRCDISRRKCVPEGNVEWYRRQYEFYVKQLPKLLGSKMDKSKTLTLSLPAFLQRMACYTCCFSEIKSSGCRCATCNEYMTILDDYFMRTRANSENNDKFNLVLQISLLYVVGESLDERTNHDETWTEMEKLAFPLWQDSSMDADKASRSKKKVTFYSNDHTDENANAAKFDKNSRVAWQMYIKLNFCAKHYLNKSVEDILASFAAGVKMKFGESSLAGGAVANCSIRKIYISGLAYNVEAGTNGDYNYINIYDE
ncbi:uncharacterized protein LODBEIA_P58440 [Lodderomyces beijingensis]|uniref:F-box domain-containing protein n=1 Tax=Lodderomyces beijingensis TaxID=1775926 RepID=A0ABP0ZU08_9ASCO